jgi:hypothetical protein
LKENIIAVFAAKGKLKKNLLSIDPLDENY